MRRRFHDQESEVYPWAAAPAGSPALPDTRVPARTFSPSPAGVFLSERALVRRVFGAEREVFHSPRASERNHAHRGAWLPPQVLRSPTRSSLLWEARGPG